MSLRSYYKTLTLLRKSEASDDDWSTPIGTLQEVKKFQGLIQTPRSTKTFRNAKDTSNINGILFTSVANGKVIQNGDIVQNTGGDRYVISGSGSQPDGVTGIRSHHVEFGLEDYDG